MFPQIVVLFVLLASSTTLAIPHGRGPLLSRKAKICSLDPEDPTSWGPSGASDYMEAWFAANGTTDWLENMDQVTTTIDGFDSTLNCKDLGGNTCPAPTIPCKGQYAEEHALLLAPADIITRLYSTRVTLHPYCCYQCA
jgi:hypothetical protein